MSVQINPGQVLEGLTRANSDLDNMKMSAIEPLRAPISEFVGTTELLGRGYAALKSYMEAEYQTLIREYQGAIEALSLANTTHSSIIDTYISKYSFLDMNLIIQEIDDLNEELSQLARDLSALNTSCPFTVGVECSFTASQRQSILDQRDIVNGRLQEVEQKRDYFELYLSATADLYSGAFFASLENQLFRLEGVTVCGITGSVTVPTVREAEVMRLRAAMVEGYDEDGNRIYNWEMIEEILGRPETEISGEEFYALAHIFTEMTSGEDLTRFIRLLGYPIDETYVRLDTLDGDILCTTWRLCLDKLGVFMGILYGMYSVERDLQGITLIAFHEDDITPKPDTPWRAAIPILDRLVMMKMLTDAQLQNNTSFGGTGGLGPNITIASGDGGFYFSFYLAHPFIEWTGNRGTHHTLPNHFFVHNTVIGSEVAHLMRDAAKEMLTTDPIEVRFIQNLAHATLNAAVKKGLEIAINLNPVTIAGSIVVDVYKTIAGENKEAQQIMHTFDAAVYAVDAAYGAKHVVAVNPIGVPSFQLHLFDTFYSPYIEERQSSPDEPIPQD